MSAKKASRLLGWSSVENTTGATRARELPSRRAAIILTPGWMLAYDSEGTRSSVVISPVFCVCAHQTEMETPLSDFLTPRFGGS